jgi:TPR repeat protein
MPGMRWFATLLFLALSVFAGAPTIADAIKAQKQCYKGDSAACEDAGLRYLHATGVVQDVGAAIRLLDTACQAGAASACAELGEAYRTRNEESDEPKLVAALRKACDLGSADGCAQIAEAAADGEGVDYDRFAAFEQAQKACEAGSSLGCAVAGEVSTLAESSSWLQRSCAAGNARGCADLAWTSRGADATALSWAETSCQSGSPDACLLAAVALREGWGQPAPDPDAADKLASAQCGTWESCEELGWLVENGRSGHPRSRPLAREAYAAACREHGWWGCLQQARIERANSDLSGARAVYDTVCHADHPRVCHMGQRQFQVGSIFGRQDNTWTVTVPDCTSYHASACENLGWMQVEGFGGPADPTGGAALVERSCELGRSSACGDQAFEAVAADPSDADAQTRLWEACGKDTDSCLEIARLLEFEKIPQPDQRPPVGALLASTCAGGREQACIDLAVWGGEEGAARVGHQCDVGNTGACQAAARVAADPGASKARFLQACAKGDEFACLLADDPRGAAAISAACERYPATCGELALAEHLGLVPGDPAELARKACDAGSLGGCTVLGDIERKVGDAPWAGCGTHQTGCVWYAKGRPDAAKLLGTGCDAGDSLSCVELGHLLAKADPRAAARTLAAACADALPTKRGIAAYHAQWEACREAAALDPSLRDVTTDRACRLGIAELCSP